MLDKLHQQDIHADLFSKQIFLDIGVLKMFLQWWLFYTSLHAQNGTRYLSKVFPAKFKSSILRMSMRSGWFPTLRLIQTDCIKFRCRCNFQHEFPYSSMSVFSPGCFWSWSTQIFYLDKDATFCRDVVPCCKANADAVQVWWFDSCHCVLV